MNFHIFDRLLSMDIVSMPITESKQSAKTDKLSNVDTDKNEQKLKSKKNAEYSAIFVENLLIK
jgi:hypothetical protein